MDDGHKRSKRSMVNPIASFTKGRSGPEGATTSLDSVEKSQGVLSSLPINNQKNEASSGHSMNSLSSDQRKSHVESPLKFGEESQRQADPAVESTKELFLKLNSSTNRDIFTVEKVGMVQPPPLFPNFRQGKLLNSRSAGLDHSQLDSKGVDNVDATDSKNRTTQNEKINNKNIDDVTKGTETTEEAVSNQNQNKNGAKNLVSTNDKNTSDPSIENLETSIKPLTTHVNEDLDIIMQLQAEDTLSPTAFRTPKSMLPPAVESTKELFKTINASNEYQVTKVNDDEFHPPSLHNITVSSTRFSNGGISERLHKSSTEEQNDTVPVLKSYKQPMAPSESHVEDNETGKLRQTRNSEILPLNQLVQDLVEQDPASEDPNNLHDGLKDLYQPPHVVFSSTKTGKSISTVKPVASAHETVTDSIAQKENHSESSADDDKEEDSVVGAPHRLEVETDDLYRESRALNKKKKSCCLNEKKKRARRTCVNVNEKENSCVAARENPEENPEENPNPEETPGPENTNVPNAKNSSISTAEFQKIIYDTLVKPRPETDVFAQHIRNKTRSKRSISLSRLIADPKVKIDVPQTLENLGTATKNAFEDETAPLYHLRNLVGSTKNTMLSLMRIPPQNLIVPSHYKIDKIQDEDVISKTLNPTDDQVAAINPSILTRGSFLQNSGEHYVPASVEDPLQVMDTFQRLGAVIRESIKSGQDTLTHFGDIINDGRNIIHTAKQATPKIWLPYARAAVLQKPYKSSKIRTASNNKAVIITPRILDIKTGENLRRNPVDSRPDFVGLGDIMDAVGVSKSNHPDLGLDKITLEARQKPVHKISAILSELNDKKNKVEETQKDIVEKALNTLNSAKKSTGSKSHKDFVADMRQKLDDYRNNVVKRTKYYKNNGRQKTKYVKDIAEDLEDLEEAKDKHVDTFLENLLDLKPNNKKKIYSTKSYLGPILRSRIDNDIEENTNAIKKTTSDKVVTENHDNEKLNNISEEREEIKETTELDDREGDHGFYVDAFPSDEITSDDEPDEISRKVVKRETAQVVNNNKEAINKTHDSNLTPDEHGIQQVAQETSHEDRYISHDRLPVGFEPRIPLSNLDIAPENSDDIVGAGLPLIPELMKPFMGRASENDLQQFYRSSPDSKNRRPNHRTVDLLTDEMGTMEHRAQGDEEIVGSMHMSGKVLEPFFGLATPEARSELYNAYNFEDRFADFIYRDTGYDPMYGELIPRDNCYFD